MGEFKHRFFDKIEEGMQKGITDFFLYGDMVEKDLFYNDAVGVLDLNESLVCNLIIRQRFDEVFLLSPDGLHVYKKNLNTHKKFTLQKITHQEFSTQYLNQSGASRNVLSNASRSSSPPSGSTQEATRTINRDTDSIQNYFTNFSTFLRSSRISRAVIVDRLKWIALLFEGKDHNINILEEIQSWRNISLEPHFVFIPISTLDILKKYYTVNESDPGVIYVSEPTVYEIEMGLSRKDFLENNMLSESTYKYLASQSKNSKNTLLTSLHLLSAVRSTIGNEYYNEEVLKTEFRNRVSSPIDDIKWENVFLNPQEKTTIENLFLIFDKGSPEERKKLPKGILLYGPPGTGKTHIARALANRGGYFFYPLKLADIKGEYVGQSGKNVQRIFREARSASPTLLFIDEVDTIFGKRGGQNQDSFSVDIINQFLAEVDGVDTGSQRIFLVCTTNRPELIDNAVFSRLRGISINLPDSENRLKMFQENLGTLVNTGLYPEVEAQLLKKTNGLSGRDIKGISGSITNYLKMGMDFSVASEKAMDEEIKKIVRLQSNEIFSPLLYDPEKPGDDFSKFLGYEETKKTVKLTIRAMLQSEKFIQYNSSPLNGILLYGPPGNGKTHFAICCANEFRLHFIKVVSSNLANMYYDGMIKQLQEIVEKSVFLSNFNPVLLFFDEFDAIASNQMDIRFRGAFLDTINQLRKMNSVVLMAATNFYEILDEASIRKGRFDRHVEFPNPSKEDVLQIFKSFLSDPRVDSSEITHPEEIIGRLLQKKENPSISDTKTFYEEAKMRAILENSIHVEEDRVLLKQEYFG